jgi:hypothetical protein
MTDQAIKLPHPVAVWRGDQTFQLTADSHLHMERWQDYALYTADQLRQAVLEERERCIGILEGALDLDERSVNWTETERVLDDVLRNLANDIRNG